MNTFKISIGTLAISILAPVGVAFGHCDPIEGTNYFDSINPLVLPQPGFNDFNGPLVPGPNVGPNGILDSDEFALLAQAISSHSSPLHEDGCAAFAANLAQATIDLPAGYRETVAAYFTLGDSDSVTAMVAFFAFFAIDLDPADYNLSQAAFLGPDGDADGDGLTNKEEYDAIVGTGGPGSAKRTQYLTDALSAAPAEGEQEGEDCTVSPLPNLNPQGEAFYQVLALLALQPYTWDSTDVDGTGIVDRFEVALAKYVINNGGLLHQEAQCPYSNNFAAANVEANVGLVQVQTGVDVKELFAVLMSISSEMQTVLGTIGLTGTYSVVESNHKHLVEPLAPSGDPDGDGLTNLEEYENVVAAGGNEISYIGAALNPLLDGTNAINPNLPVASGAGVAILLGVFGSAGALLLNRRKK